MQLKTAQVPAWALSLTPLCPHPLETLKPMNLIGKVRPGMWIVGPDDHIYGEIEQYDEASLYVDGRRIPVSAIERLDGDRLYLSAAGAAAMLAEGTREPAANGEARLPLVEERLEVDARQVDLGEIRVHKTVEEVDEVWREPLTHEEVQVERIRVNRPVAAPEERRQEGEWLVIPIMEETIVIRKQLVVVEEIRIRKHRVTEQREGHETVRRERASIEDTRAQASSAPQSPARTNREDPAWEALRDDIRTSNG